MAKKIDRLEGLGYRHDKSNKVIIADTMDLLNLLTDFYNEVPGCHDKENLWKHFIICTQRDSINFLTDFVDNIIVKDKRVTIENTKLRRIEGFLKDMIEKVCIPTTETNIIS